MRGGRRVPLVRFRGELNVKPRSFALEHFRTLRAFDAFQGRINRDLFRFTVRPHNAFSRSAAYCSSVISSRFSRPAFVPRTIFQAPK
jgi:hypothetical protein